MSKNENNKKYTLIMLAIVVGLITVSIILDYKTSMLGQVCAIVSLIFIYKVYSTNWKKFLYTCILVFSFINILLTIPMSKIIGVDQDLHVFYFLVGIYMVTYICFNIKKISFKVFLKPINLFISLFIAYIYISLILVTDFKSAVIKLVFYTIMICYGFIIIVENRTKEDIKETLSVLKYISFVVISLGLFKIITTIQIEGKSHFVNYCKGVENVVAPYDRIPTLFYYNPNDFSVVAMFILVGFAVKFLTDKTKKEKIVSLLVIVGAQVNIFFSGSRTGWIATVATLAFLVLFLIIKLEKKLVFKSLIIAIVVSCSFFVTLKIPMLGDYTKKMNEIINTDESNPEGNKIEIGSTGSLNVRSTLMVNSIESIVKDKNYFGVGVGNSSEYHKMRNNTHWRFDTHNWWFEILLEFGIPGFLFFFIFYTLICLKFIFKYNRNNNENKFFYLFALIMLAGNSLGVFGPSSVVRFAPFWIALALPIAIANCNEFEVLKEK